MRVWNHNINSAETIPDGAPLLPHQSHMDPNGNPPRGVFVTTQDDPGDSNAPRFTRPQADAVVETKTAPRVTEDSIKAKIKHVSYIVHEHLTLCILELQNGFFLVGQSAPASPANFDADVGQRYSYDQAFRKAWELEGYALRENLHAQQMADEANLASGNYHGIGI